MTRDCHAKAPATFVTKPGGGPTPRDARRGGQERRPLGRGER